MRLPGELVVQLVEERPELPLVLVRLGLLGADRRRGRRGRRERGGLVLGRPLRVAVAVDPEGGALAGPDAAAVVANDTILHSAKKKIEIKN